MNTTGTAAPGRGALELPPFSLDVQALDLGGGVKAVGLELVETENREPVRGKDAAEIWSAVFPALAGDDSYVVDFFSHLERVRLGFATRLSVASCCRSQIKNSCGRSLNVSKARHLASGRARRRNPQMRRSKGTCRSVEWMRTNWPTDATLFAAFASRRTAG